MRLDANCFDNQLASVQRERVSVQQSHPRLDRLFAARDHN